LKKATTILIIITLLLQCFAHYSVVALFELKRDYIAKNLCENRDKPQLNCCGKCYLRKQLKKVDNTTPSKNRPNERAPIELLAFIVPPPLILNHPYLFFISVYNPVFQDLFDIVVPDALLRPPSNYC
jgi:hypothetical protein